MANNDKRILNMEPEEMSAKNQELKYSEEIEIYEEYHKLLNISTETLEKMAYRDQAYALRTKNLKEKYKNFCRSKKILKIIEIIRYLQEKQQEAERNE